MTLIEEALRAEDISNALTKYRTPNPDCVQSINAAIAELAGLSSALRIVYELTEEHGENLHIIEDDLRFVHESVTFTLADVWHIIGTIGERPQSPLAPEDYRRNWKKITRYNRERGKQDFSVRIDTHKRFIQVLCKIIQSQETKHQDAVASLQNELRTLRLDLRDIAHPAARKGTDMEEKVVTVGKEATGNLAANTIVTKRSYERQRNLAPKSPSDSGSSTSPSAMPLDPSFSPPLLPTTTFSTVSNVSSVDREGEHWAVQIFRESSSWTPLPASKTKSEYHDAPGQPQSDPPDESYERVLALAFPPDPPGLRVFLFCRRQDWRSKILARWKDHRGKVRTACLPLNMLKVYRSGAMLYLCRRLQDGQTNLAWLSLKFSSLERLILFACTFLSMRAHDGKRPERPIDDWEFVGEESEYAGKIRDNGFGHALRIYRDRVSKAIRLQASVHGGQLDNTPIWTAFITHYVTSRTWCHRIDRSTVCLRELRPHSFSSNYEFQRLPNAAFVLNFDSKGGTTEFHQIQLTHLHEQMQKISSAESKILVESIGKCEFDLENSPI